MKLGAVVAVALVACASRPPRMKVDARFAAYRTDFHTVWSATTGELKQSFKWGLAVEDASSGRIETAWKRVENARDSMSAEVTAQYVFRVKLHVVPEGNAWRIELDGEAALYRPEMSVLQPFKHGAVDEPRWVKGRVDAVRTALHRRLEAHATLSKPTIVL